jgi:hypothetical protein
MGKILVLYIFIFVFLASSEEDKGSKVHGKKHSL